MRTCQIEGCDKPHNCRGWCRKHYARWQRFGDPLTLRPNAPTARERFMAKVEVAAAGCWIWTPGPAHEFGYGNFWLNGKTVMAHRAAYLIFNGHLPSSDLVLDHLCRNPRCVNPDHLEPVTQRENLLRGDTFQAKNAAKTHCKRGHEYTPENTYRLKATNERVCRECCRLKYQRRKAERGAA